MKDLSKLIDIEKYVGVMFIGDLHNVVQNLKQAIDYAREHDLFLVSVGDLFDGGEYPYEVAELVLEMLDKTDRYGQVRGNHDNKMYRYAIGNPVKLSSDQHETLTKVGEHRHDDFVDKVKKIYTHPKSAYCYYLQNMRIVHAGIHRRLWEDVYEIKGGIKSLALYGEKDGTIDEDGYPRRVYNWVKDIPKWHIGIAGHDRSALEKDKKEPLLHTNENGGYMFFIDTSCGKDEKGPLTGAVFLNSPGGLSFSKFETFK